MTEKDEIRQNSTVQKFIETVNNSLAGLSREEQDKVLIELKKRLFMGREEPKTVDK